MCVVVNIVWISLEWSNPKVNHLMSDVVTQISVVPHNKLCFKELGHIKNDGEEDWREDIGQEVDFEGVSQLVALVEDRLVHSHEPLSGDAHDQEGLEAQEDVLHRVEEVREEQNVDVVGKILRYISKNKDQKCDVTYSKGHQALIEGRLEAWTFEYDDSEEVTNQT